MQILQFNPHRNFQTRNQIINQVSVAARKRVDKVRDPKQITLKSLQMLLHHTPLLFQNNGNRDARKWVTAKLSNSGGFIKPSFTYASLRLETKFAKKIQPDLTGKR